jgi:prevent-host-death family protein
MLQFAQTEHFLEGQDIDAEAPAEAFLKLSQLVERAAAGEEIIIAKTGRSLARLVPLAKRTTPRPLGLYAGQVKVGPHFEGPLPKSFLRAFEE